MLRVFIKKLVVFFTGPGFEGVERTEEDQEHVVDEGEDDGHCRHATGLQSTATINQNIKLPKCCAPKCALYFDISRLTSLHSTYVCLDSFTKIFFPNFRKYFL